MSAIRDLKGQVFGDFKVLHKSGPHFWRVKCETCGVEEDKNKVAIVYKKRPCQSCKHNRWLDEQREKKQAESKGTGSETSVSEGAD